MIDFEHEDPIDAIRRLTGGIGPDRVIDAVGVEAERPETGPAAGRVETPDEEFEREVSQTAPETNVQGDLWQPGGAPSMAMRWAVRSAAKAGTIGIIGVYPPQVEAFPIGEALNKNLTVRTGICNHRRYIPDLVDLVRAGVVDPGGVLTQSAGISSAIDAYAHFDRRESGWTKVELEPVG